jgi:glycosyltransferase involved in cell wall biosynthesis
LKSRTHIVFLTNEYPPAEHGGIGTFTQTIARGLVSLGHRVTVAGNYPLEKKGIEDDNGVRVIRLPIHKIPKGGFVFNSFRLRRLLSEIQKDHKIDIVEGPNLSLAYLSRSFPVAKILRIHTTISTTKKPRIARAWLIRRAFNVADYVCAVSDFCAESNRENLGLNSRRIKILFNPVDTSIFQPRSLELQQDGAILFIGTVCENKGVRQLVQAMPEIIASFPSAQLWIVGRDWPDPITGRPFADTLRTEMHPDVGQHIQFKGPVDHDEVPDLISRAQVCVFPSHLENMPVAWLEAMAMGKAIVASKTGPGPEILEDGLSGILCDPFDPSSIADGVIKLLKSEDLPVQLGKQAPKRAAGNFSLNSILQQNVSFYRECLNSYKANGSRWQ